MPKFQKLREAKQIGNAIRKARIAKGEALTNISGVFKISIMELNAIEDGNLYGGFKYEVQHVLKTA